MDGEIERNKVARRDPPLKKGHSNMEHINKGILALVERPELRHESLREGIVAVEERVCQFVGRPGIYRIFTVNHGIPDSSGQYNFRHACARTADETERMLREGLTEGREFADVLTEIITGTVRRGGAA